MDWLWPHAIRWFLVTAAIAVYLVLVTALLWLGPRRQAPPRIAHVPRHAFRHRHAA